MEKETKSMLLIYVLPILVLSGILSVVHPIVAQTVLWMLIGSGLIAVGMAFLIDWYEKKN